MTVLSDVLMFLWDWRWLTTAAVLVLSYISYHVVSFYRKVSKYPKGPFPLPLVGNLLGLRNVKQLHKKAEEWSRKYGDMCTLWMGEKPMLMLNTYQVMKEAFIDKRHEFAGRFSTKLGAFQTQGNHDVVFEDYNPTWKALRKVVATAVRKYAMCDSIEVLCTDVVDAFVNSLEKGPNAIDSKDPFLFIVFNIIDTSVFGTKFEKEGPEVARVKQIYKAFTELAPNGLPSDIVPWLGILFKKRERKIESLLVDFYEQLDRLYKKAVYSYVPGTIQNFTHSLLAAREEALQQEKSDSQYLTEANMVHVLLDIFGAASDALIGELRWLCLAMTRRPEIQAKIQQEIEDQLGQTPPTLKDKEKLPYTVAYLYETLRVYPIAPLALPHKTSCDTRVGGKFIPKDTGLLYSVHAVNHDPALWKDPEVFKPERFLDPVTGKLNLEGLPPLLTFGLGPRACPGEKLAHIDMFYVLVRLMQRVTCSVPAGTMSTDIKEADSSVFLVPAKQGIIFTRRN